MTPPLPRCPYSDLEPHSCAHCQGTDDHTVTIVRLADLQPATRTRYRAHRRPDSGPWQFGTPRHPNGDQAGTQAAVDPVIIDCDHPHDTGICDPCWHMLQLCLGDIPALVHDLNTAITKDVHFTPHGHRHDDPERPDEAPIMVNLGASAALRQLATALHTPHASNGWTLGQAVVAQSRRLLNHGTHLRISDGIGDRAATISQAVVHAHRVIDRPADRWFYGECPHCGDDIHDERGVEYVACECGYAAALVDHQATMLDRRQNEKLTIDELVGALTSAGQTITRQRIKDLVRRRGLPRERQARPRWVPDRHGNVRLVSTEVWVHRIGDVLDLLTATDQQTG